MRICCSLLNEIASCGGVSSELSVDHVGHQRSVQHGKRALDISVQIAFIQGVPRKLLLKRKNGLSVVELGQKFCLHVVGEHALDSVYNLLLGAEENEFARAGVLRSAGIYFGVFKLKILSGKGLVKRVCDYVIFELGNARRKLFILLREAIAKQRSDARPELTAYLDSIEDYDVIYIGGSVYCGEYPQEIYSQLDRLSFVGKVIKPFTTHEGSGLGKCVEVLRKKCAGGKVEEGLAIKGSEVLLPESKAHVRDWVIR